MMKLSNPSRLLALATAGILSASVLLAPAPARADKAKTYKYGAVALGVLGGYLLSKGKTVAGAAVLGAGAYSYKKGEDTRKANKYDNYSKYGNRYGYNNNGGRSGYNNNGYNNNGDRYSYNNSYDNGYDVPDRNRPGNRDNNRNSEYRAYKSDDRYDSRDRDTRGNKNPKIRVR